MITYTLPDFTQNLGLNLFFCRLLKENPEICIENVDVGSIYGCFPNCTLNGGRALVLQPYTKQKIEQTYSILDEYGLTARLTLTNMFPCAEDFNNEYLNTILDFGSKHGAQAIVYSDKVAKFVREKYDMKTILSTTRNITDINEFNAACKVHDWVVLDYSFHKDDAFLAAIKQPKKAEIMVNEFCVKGCKQREKHYQHNSVDQQNNVITEFVCQHNKADFFKHESGHPVIFTTEEVQNLSNKYGIQYFKIVGRGVPFATVLEALTYYLIKPQYHKDVKELVMRNMRNS